MEKLCDINDIPDPGSKSLRFNNKSCFAVRYRGEVYLYENSCPHLGVELNWQEDMFLDVDEQFVQCASHGALFLIESGECVAGPCLGSALHALPCKVENGSLYAVTESDSVLARGGQ